MKKLFLKNIGFGLLAMCLLWVGCEQVLQVDTEIDWREKKLFAVPLQSAGVQNKLIVGYDDGQLWVYDLPQAQSAVTDKKSLDFGYSLGVVIGRITGLEVSQDGSKLVVLSDSSERTYVNVWTNVLDQNNRPKKFSIDGILRFDKIAISQDGKKFSLTAPVDKRAYVVDIESLHLDAMIDMSTWISSMNVSKITADFLSSKTEYGQVLRMMSVCDGKIYTYEMILSEQKVALVGYTKEYSWQFEDSDKNVINIQHASLVKKHSDKDMNYIAVIGQNPKNKEIYLARFGFKSFIVDKPDINKALEWLTVGLYTVYDSISMVSFAHSNWHILYFNRSGETGVTAAQSGLTVIPSFIDLDKDDNKSLTDSRFNDDGSLVLVCSSTGHVLIHSTQDEPNIVRFQTPLKKKINL